MAKITKVIDNNENILGLVWESNGKEVVILDREVKIDINSGLKIKDFAGKGDEFIDLIDIITNAINKIK
jgi:hypothetical protein